MFKSIGLRILLSLCLLSGAWGSEMRFVTVKPIQQSGQLLLQLRLDIELDEPQKEALLNGISLTFVYDMVVQRQRDYWFDYTIAALNQFYTLTYHSLSKQYVVHHVELDKARSFPTLGLALEYLGYIEQLWVLDTHVLDRNEIYQGVVRAYLDIESLPAPMRPVAYLSKSWRMKTPAYVLAIPSPS